MSNIELKLNISLRNPIDATEATKSANKGIGIGDERWRTLCDEPIRTQHIDEVQLLAEALKPNCINFLLLGIGGSALGAKALHRALGEQTPHFYTLDNIDPSTVEQTIFAIQQSDSTFEQTVVAVISKSGETAEILALLMVIEQAMQNATFVAITGKSGSLQEYAISKNWATLPVPDGVGGRFSVLSPVGLFPAAMCGISIEELLDGANEMDSLCQQVEHNPAAKLASALVGSMQEGRPIHVMMPYCDRMIQFAHWYVQLWAESLGKIDESSKRVGPTPIASIGATDQHSMLQLWREGPTDKVIGFVRVLDFPAMELGNSTISESQEWLCGKTLGALFLAQHIATEEAMHSANQATWTMTLDSINAHSVGQFIALWQATVAIAGRLLGVNPYNQPGVELGKQLTRNALK
jgi:glucose-6-phosphate isomerase